MSEAELHCAWNTGMAAFALRGFSWGKAGGEVRFRPDETVVNAVRHVFANVARPVRGGASGRLTFARLAFPLRMHQGADIR